MLMGRWDKVLKKLSILLLFALLLSGCAKDAQTGEETVSGDTAEPTESEIVTDDSVDPMGVSASFEIIKEEWQPDQRFETDEYIYGVDDLAIEPTSDGKYKISFVFGIVFNLDIYEYDLEKYNADFYPVELSEDQEFSNQLEFISWAPSGPSKVYYFGPFLQYYEYISDTMPETLFMRTQQLYIIDRHAEFMADDAALYDVTFGEHVTDGRYPATPVTFSFGFEPADDYGRLWKSGILTIDGTDYETEASGMDYTFYLPDGVSIDDGYTLVLRGKYIPVSQSVFEIVLPE